MSQLTLGFAPDEDDTNRLDITVHAPPFSGAGWCWTDRASIEAFGASLAAYPMSPGEPAVFSMGYNHLEGEDLIGRIEIGAADAVGNLFVRVEVADPHEQWRRVRAEFRTHYPDVERFRAQLARMLEGDRPSAVLEGE